MWRKSDVVVAKLQHSNEDVRASTMLPSLLQHQSHAQIRVPRAAARGCHVLRGLPPRALVPELGDNGDCVLHEGYRCVLAQRRRPHSAGCRRHRLKASPVGAPVLPR